MNVLISHLLQLFLSVHYPVFFSHNADKLDEGDEEVYQARSRGGWPPGSRPLQPGRANELSSLGHRALITALLSYSLRLVQ